jgi:DNA-binding NarL/FixJ family response regulator
VNTDVLRHATVATVLVVDAHPVTRRGLSQLIAEQFDLKVVGEAGDAAGAVLAVDRLRPDVMCIGITLPDRDGLSLVKDLRDRHEQLGIVVLTSHGDDDMLFGALDAGASAFVCKNAPVAEVMSALRHSAVSAASFTSTGLAGALRRRSAGSRAALLSPRERQVLQLLANGRSVSEVAIELYVSLSTAKTYVSRLYDKLGADNRAQALMAAVRLGLTDQLVAV